MFAVVTSPTDAIAPLGADSDFSIMTLGGPPDRATTSPSIPVIVVALLGATAPAVAMPYVLQFCWLVKPDTGEATSPYMLPVCGMMDDAVCCV